MDFQPPFFLKLPVEERPDSVECRVTDFLPAFILARLLRFLPNTFEP